jgi:hypothetical protein
MCEIWFQIALKLKINGFFIYKIPQVKDKRDYLFIYLFFSLLWSWNEIAINSNGSRSSTCSCHIFVVAYNCIKSPCIHVFMCCDASFMMATLSLDLLSMIKIWDRSWIAEIHFINYTIGKKKKKKRVGFSVYVYN